MPDKTFEYPSIAYHFQFKEADEYFMERDETGLPLEFFKKNRPEILFTTPYEDDSIYMAGKYRGTGNVMKLDKKTG